MPGLLIGEPAAQAAKAMAMLDELRGGGKRGAVSDLVLGEAYFALQDHYEAPRQVALDRLREFLESHEIEPTGQALSVLVHPSLGKS